MNSRNLRRRHGHGNSRLRLKAEKTSRILRVWRRTGSNMCLNLSNTERGRPQTGLFSYLKSSPPPPSPDSCPRFHSPSLLDECCFLVGLPFALRHGETSLFGDSFLNQTRQEPLLQKWHSRNSDLVSAADYGKKRSKPLILPPTTTPCCPRLRSREHKQGDASGILALVICDDGVQGGWIVDR